MPNINDRSKNANSDTHVMHGTVDITLYYGGFPTVLFYIPKLVWQDMSA